MQAIESKGMAGGSLQGTKHRLKFLRHRHGGRNGLRPGGAGVGGRGFSPGGDESHFA